MKARPAVVATSAIIVLAALLTGGTASAASPVLEFVVPGHSLPISFTTEGGELNAEMEGFDSLVHCTASHGQGEITGPRSAVAEYQFTGCVTQKGSNQKCKTEGANEEEITTGPIDADLVWIDQSKDEVGILLDPLGGTYIAFECGGESAEGRGPFLSPVSPLNKQSTLFTAILSQSGSMQTPDEYEGENGEKLKATPTGKHGINALVPTGVETTIMVHPSFSGEIRAITAAEVEAKQHEEAATAKKHEEEAAKKKHEEEAAAAAKKRQEEESAKKRAEEEVAAAIKHREEEAAANRQRGEEAMASLNAAIRGLLTSTGKATKIGSLLKHGGLTLVFSSSEPGVLVIQWWQVPPGAHLTKNGHRRQVLIAQGGATFSRAGVGKVKISLTRKGRGLLERATKLTLTSRVRFTPAAHPTISAIGVVTLKR
jgi:hypothetical protein